MKPKNVCKVERAVASALLRARAIEVATALSTLSFLRSYLPYCLFVFPFLFLSCEREQRPLVVQPPSA
ncbi:MAG: hypothetical protein ACJ8KC_02985, partial [Candidatus Udaeobacter sp.]